jgi:2-polyprenyl-3-methyl-5-hydroxy-6-metoxy-1,4-benzoquinol methylase
MRDKLRKLITDPFGVIDHRLSSLIEQIRYKRGKGYKAESYWTARHSKFQFDPRGVGDRYLTVEENLKQLHIGGQLLLELCNEEKIDFVSDRILDVGCGTGYYAQIFQHHGCTNYLGIDIVDTLFDGLRQHLPGFDFKKLDISTKPLTGMYDVIIMMDVAQHITEEQRFLFAMENLKTHLASNGVIIISTIIGKNRRLGFYVVERTLAVFRNAFDGYRFSEPISFLTNKLFSIRKA